jgi:hypothetical protein
MSDLYTKNTWIDEILSGLEKYQVKDDSGTVVYDEAEIALSTAVVQAGSPVNATRMNNIETGIEIIANALATGFIPEFDTWVYVSANSFKIVGKDVRDRFPVGVKLKCTDGGVTKFFYGFSAVMSGSDTLVTITGGSDYSLSGGAITNPYYSYGDAPQGFPGVFNYTPTWRGFTTNPVLGNGTLTGKVIINGRKVTFDIYLTAGSTTTFGSSLWYFGMPVILNAPQFTGIAYAEDYSTTTKYMGLVRTEQYTGELVINVPGSANWYASNQPITWASGDKLWIHVEIMI